MSEVYREPDVAVPLLGGWVACRECDLLLTAPTVHGGGIAQCPRCKHELYRHTPEILSRSMALSLCVLLLYVPAMFLPIMHLSLLGQSTRGTVWNGVTSLYESGMYAIAATVFLTGMAIPLVKVLCQLAVLMCIHFNVARGHGRLIYRCYRHLREWGMLEIYLMGALVSMVKLAGMAELTLGVGLACFIVLMLVQIWLEVTMSPQQIWSELSSEAADARH
ncbi:paraquat-inducible protein A [Pseudomonas sp. NPDC098747]|uniref:paraquat-inducible protein A n=1 Tax=Pseudomonas sp. NPDC098747 TaxID=3364487 RepID=UPI00383A29EB